MLGQEHLTLRLVRLRAAEQWSQGPGLTFLFPKGGQGNYLWGHLTQRLSPGDVAVLSGEPQGRLCVTEGEEMVFWSFSLLLEHLFPLFAANEIALLQGLVEGLRGVKLHAAPSRLAAECHRLVGELPPQFNLDHRSQLLRIAASILTEEFKNVRRQRVGYVQAEEHLVQAFEKLSTEQLLRLPVQELAERFGCSRRHLNRLFHKHFGFSIVGLRMEMRLLKAISLLRDPSAKVIHVAEQAGFNHLGLFNSCFRKRFGTSPGQWRKLAAQDQGAGPALSGANANCPLGSHGRCPWLSRRAPLPAAPASGGANSWRAGAFPVVNGPGRNGAVDPAAARKPGSRTSNSQAGPQAEPESEAGLSADPKTPATVLLERCAQL